MDSSKYMSIIPSPLPHLKLTSHSGLASILGSSVAFFLFYYLIVGIYHLYFSPLRAIPGPKSWIFFPLLRHLVEVRGDLDIYCRRYFDYYKSPVIRISPDELLFISAPAWQDIYGHGHTPQMPKTSRSAPNEPINIIISNDADHTRFRRALAHAFSEKALREQEDLIQNYVNYFIERLSELSDQGQPADMTAWYNFLTFDIIGDLSFGKPFGCLKKGLYHWWVTDLIKGIEFICFRRMSLAFPLFTRIWSLFSASQAKDMREARARMMKYSHTLVLERLNTESQAGRKDFIDLMQRNKGDSKEISEDETFSNMFILIAAGSETTASVMAGTTYWLLHTPDVLRRLKEEVRSTFKSEEEITLHAVTTKLPYTVACLQEGLRIYPPVPGCLSRETLKDEVISGYHVPKGTKVGVHHSGAYWSESNFHHATEFIPERWLPEALNNPQNEFYHDNRSVHEPFHTGPRNCLGRNLALAEMRLIMAKFIYKFDFEFAPSMLTPLADKGNKLLAETWPWQQKASLIWKKPELNVLLKRRKLE